MQLRRTAGGVIRDGATPITLVGGFHYLFQKDAMADAGIVDGQNRLILRNETCPPDTRPPGKISRWTGTQMLEAMVEPSPKLNLLRIFLTNGSEMSGPNPPVPGVLPNTPIDVYPYFRDANGKLKIKEAVQSNQWNPTYFTRLRQFADAADAAGVALQLSLFNFFDFDNQANIWREAWRESVWNPNNSADRAWGDANLVADGTETQRSHNFMRTTNNPTLAVQEAFVIKVMDTLRNRGNIILEICNEPRGIANVTTPEDQAKWLSRVTSWIVSPDRGWRPLISVNAFHSYPNAPKFDIDAWKDAGLAHYDKVDLISYHGISGTVGTYSICNGSAEEQLPFNDRDAIAARVDTHERNHGGTALIASTDGIHKPSHRFSSSAYGPPELDYSRRDGQIDTPMTDDTTELADAQRKQSDLSNWTYWTLIHAAAKPGTVHFQNHSTYSAAIEPVRAAYKKAFAAPPQTGDDLRPPFSQPAWRPWTKAEGALKNFTATVRHHANTGETVNQYGTLASPPDLGSGASNEAGFAYRFVASATQRQSFIVSYTPVSVSEVETGGSSSVKPKIVARLHEAAGDQPGAILSPPAPEVVVARNAPAGTLTVAADLIAGRTYFLVITSRIELSYHNRIRAYGEVIVRFPSIRRAP